MNRHDDDDDDDEVVVAGSTRPAVVDGNNDDSERELRIVVAIVSIVRSPEFPLSGRTEIRNGEQ